MGFFTSQDMKVQLMVYKDSKKNEREMLGNKTFTKIAKPTTFQQENLLFFWNFLRFHAEKHQGISLNLRATYALNALKNL
jgi:hypothetical protein